MPTRRSAVRIQLLLGLIFAVSLVALAFAADFPVPYRDDWEFLRIIVGQPLSIAGLTEPLNEHLVLLPRLLTTLQYHLEGAVGRLLTTIALVCQFGIAALFLGRIRRRWTDDAETATLVSGLALVCLCFAYQLQSMVFDAATIFPMVVAFSIIAIACECDALDAKELRRVRFWTLVALVATAAAALTTPAGALVPWILAGLSLLDRRRVQRASGWIAVALVLIAFYWHFERDVVGMDMSGMVTSPLELLAYFFAFFASFVGFAGAGPATLVGMAIVAGGLVAVWQTARSTRAVLPIERFAAAVIVFAFMSAALSAPARARLGIIQGTQSRYASISLVAWAAILVFACSRWISPARLGTRGTAMLAVAISVVVIPLQVFTGLVWLAKADHLATARQALVVGVRDDSWIVGMTRPFRATTALQTVEVLKARGDRALVDPRLGRALQGATPATACEGHVELTRPMGDGSGWRVGGVLTSTATEALIVDRDGVVRGLARLAPPSREADPRPWDVVRAVLGELVD